MKYQWYVFDSENPGKILGCNDVDLLEKYVDDSQYTLLSAQHGVLFNGSRSQNNVTDLEDELASDDSTVDDEEEEDDDEDDDEVSSEDKENEVNDEEDSDSKW